MGTFIFAFFAFGIIRFIISPHYGDNDPYHQVVARSR
jgi:hypothetical protein